MTYQTDERLKSYLDTNQLCREQMCLAVLALDKRFTEVRPRHPRGGPDGGRDIEAIFRGKQLAFGAVGFVNQADDSKEKKKVICVKFKADLTAALQATPSPEVFVFLSNVNLSVSEKDELVATARSRGLVHCEIFDRERLRIYLDSPDGFAIRFQYLGLALSEAEQASFFAKWGDDINSVISTGFHKVQRTLDHLLFLQEATNSICSFQVAFELDRNYSAKEIGHFRAFCSIYLMEPKLKILSILLGSSDKANRFREDIVAAERACSPGIEFGIGGGQWEQYLQQPKSSDGEVTSEVIDDQTAEKYECVGSSSSIGMSQVNFITVSYSKSSLIRFSPVISLRDLDDCMVMPMLNLSLALKVKAIHIISNGYKLFEVSREGFYIDDTHFDPSVPVTFDQGELFDPWARISPNDSSSFRLSFSDVIPQRLFVSQQAINTLPIRQKT